MSHLKLILNNALDCVVRTANKTCGADLAEVYLTTFRNILGHNFIKNNPFCEISVTVPGVIAECSEDRVLECLDSSEIFQNKLFQGHALTSSDLDTVCSLLNSLISCLDEATSSCSVEEKSNLAVFTDTFKYLCSSSVREDCVVRTANKTCGADLAEVYLTTFRNILGHNFIKNNPFCEISVTVPGVIAECSEDRVLECLDSEIFQNKLFQGHALTSSDLDTVCSLLNSLISCLDEATSSCSVEEKSNLAVFTDTFKYLCSSSVREVYRRTSDCMLKTNLDNQTLTCLTQFINIPIEGLTSVEKCR
ncbi:hypothetical protein CAPTEDRAFT_210762 [Capitella teleta]|uniref:DUF19 domain-containing protein n=1 Tax=Capitella teleta TaxID=283909 RepID=R7UKC0_CAPTE|nr:hypothetical protein CAPTEDRAFT_210762 [Capitella teleta]|eukprot:ELU04253.1 hypothetical protein CAPTEDRAFT_210762 [Capitella teleta]